MSLSLSSWQAVIASSSVRCCVQARMFSELALWCWGLCKDVFKLFLHDCRHKLSFLFLDEPLLLCLSRKGPGMVKHTAVFRLGASKLSMECCSQECLRAWSFSILTRLQGCVTCAWCQAFFLVSAVAASCVVKAMQIGSWVFNGHFFFSGRRQKLWSNFEI